MAKVLGTSGRYVSNQAVTRFQSIVKLVMLTVSFLAALAGLTIGLAIRGASPSFWLIATLNTSVVLAIYFIWKKTNAKLATLEKEREYMRRGASGESAVAFILANLPDGYHVINDLTTTAGNIDHIVIGPTGVFVIDTKNWRGLVVADKDGELLLNGKPTDQPLIRRFVARIMALKEKFRVLAPEADPFFQPVFVFTAARVVANWGATRSVHCIRDDQLVDYILTTKFRRELNQKEIEQASQAFLALAHMDTDFSRQVLPLQPKTELQPAGI